MITMEDVHRQREEKKKGKLINLDNEEKIVLVQMIDEAFEVAFKRYNEIQKDGNVPKEVMQIMEKELRDRQSLKQKIDEAYLELLLFREDE